MATLTYSTTLSTLTCGVCAIPFAIPRDLHQRLRNTGTGFYCPNGHSISYHEDENTKLKARLDQAEADARWQAEQRCRAEEREQHERRRAAAYKGAITKAKKRVGKGVCPVAGCRRHFDNVQAHMASKHPEFADEVTP